jgi:hypothetical protein
MAANAHILAPTLDSRVSSEKKESRHMPQQMTKSRGSLCIAKKE